MTSRWAYPLIVFLALASALAADKNVSQNGTITAINKMTCYRAASQTGMNTTVWKEYLVYEIVVQVQGAEYTGDFEPNWPFHNAGPVQSCDIGQHVPVRTSKSRLYLTCPGSAEFALSGIRKTSASSPNKEQRGHDPHSDCKREGTQ